MNHIDGIRGYVVLYVILLFLFYLVSNLLMRFLTIGGVDISFDIYTSVRIFTQILIGIMLAGRFLAIEQRCPTPKERDMITTITFILGTVIFVIGGFVIFAYTSNAQTDVATPSSIKIVISTTLVSLSAFLSLYLNLGVFARLRFFEKSGEAF